MSSKANSSETTSHEKDRNVIVFHTNDSPETVILNGGYEGFRINLSVGSKCSFAGSSPLSEPNKNGLTLIAKIARIENSAQHPGRKFVRCDAFALVNLKKGWESGAQYPVAYRSWPDIFGKESTPETIQWQTRKQMMQTLGLKEKALANIAEVRATPLQYVDQMKAPQHRLSLVTAKAILAAHLQTTPDAIVIEI